MKVNKSLADDICFLAIGQCGGNIAMLFDKAGFPAYYVNTAPEDLQLVNTMNKFKIPGENGCNQDAEKAQMIYSMNHEEIQRRIKEHCTKKHVIVCSSSGGGTSAMTPLLVEELLLNIMEEEDKEWDRYDALCDSGKLPSPPVKRKVSLVLSIPSIAESSTYNGNAYDFSKQLIALTSKAITGELPNLGSIFFIDNEKNKDYLQLNKDFFVAFEKAIKIHENVSEMGNVDTADLEKAMFEPGICTIAILGKEYSDDKVISEIRHNKVLTDTESNKAMYWVSMTTDKINSIRLEKELGATVTNFATYSTNENIFITSGMGFPMERLGILAERAKESFESIAKLQQEIVDTQLTEDLSKYKRKPIVRKSEQVERVERPKRITNDTGATEIQKKVEEKPSVDFRERLGNLRARR